MGATTCIRVEVEATKKVGPTCIDVEATEDTTEAYLAAIRSFGPTPLVEIILAWVNTIALDATADIMGRISHDVIKVATAGYTKKASHITKSEPPTHQPSPLTLSSPSAVLSSLAVTRGIVDVCLGDYS